MNRRRAHLAAVVEQAELAAEIAARRSDLAAGLVPPDVHRALFTHELAARTNFAGIEDDIATNAATILERLGTDRLQFITLLLDDLRRATARPGPATPLERVALRLLDLDGPVGLDAITGAPALITDAERFHRGRLNVGADRAARRVFGEAAAQGIPIADALAPKYDDVAQHQLDLLARRAAQAPHADLIRALRDHAIAEPKDFVTADELIDRLDRHAHQLATGTLEAVADTTARQADVIGRAAGAAVLPVAKEIYASELLDRNTCGPCSLVDGRQYATLADARLDYPHGTYFRCEGGLRCRGTIVFVWPNEATPTLQTPGDTPAPRSDVNRTPPGRAIGTLEDQDDRDRHAIAHVDPRAVLNTNRRAGAFWSYYYEFQTVIRRATLNVEAGQAALRALDIAPAVRANAALDANAAARGITIADRAYTINDLRADLEATARYLVNRVRNADPTTTSLWRGMTVRPPGNPDVAAARFRVGQVWDTDIWSWSSGLDEAASYARPIAGARPDGTPVVVELLPGAQAARISDDYPGRMAGSNEYLSIGRLEIVSVAVDQGVVRLVGRLVP